jgi:hypothetical protein
LRVGEGSVLLLSLGVGAFYTSIGKGRDTGLLGRTTKQIPFHFHFLESKTNSKAPSLHNGRRHYLIMEEGGGVRVEKQTVDQLTK